MNNPKPVTNVKTVVVEIREKHAQADSKIQPESTCTS